MVTCIPNPIAAVVGVGVGVGVGVVWVVGVESFVC
jgi:hypothetical protein